MFCSIKQLYDYLHPEATFEHTFTYTNHSETKLHIELSHSTGRSVANNDSRNCTALQYANQTSIRFNFRTPTTQYYTKGTGDAVDLLFADQLSSFWMHFPDETKCPTYFMTTTTTLGDAQRTKSARFKFLPTVAMANVYLQASLCTAKTMVANWRTWNKRYDTRLTIVWYRQ